MIKNLYVYLTVAMLLIAGEFIQFALASSTGCAALGPFASGCGADDWVNANAAAAALAPSTTASRPPASSYGRFAADHDRHFALVSSF